MSAAAPMDPAGGAPQGGGGRGTPSGNLARTARPGGRGRGSYKEAVTPAGQAPAGRGGAPRSAQPQAPGVQVRAPSPANPEGPAAASTVPDGPPPASGQLPLPATALHERVSASPVSGTGSSGRGTGETNMGPPAALTEAERLWSEANRVGMQSYALSPLNPYPDLGKSDPSWQQPTRFVEGFSPEALSVAIVHSGRRMLEGEGPMAIGDYLPLGDASRYQVMGVSWRRVHAAYCHLRWTPKATLNQRRLAYQALRWLYFDPDRLFSQYHHHLQPEQQVFHILAYLAPILPTLPAGEPGEVPPEVTVDDFVHEVMGYINLWVLDELRKELHRNLGAGRRQPPVHGRPPRPRPEIPPCPSMPPPATSSTSPQTPASRSAVYMGRPCSSRCPRFFRSGASGTWCR